MDPNTARTVLRLDPLAPLTPDAVESAFARESWERHPSRYSDAAGFEAASAWAATLAEARTALLAEVAEMAETDAAAVPGPWAMPTAPTGPAAAAGVPAGVPGAAPRPRRRTALVVGIVAASAGVLALVVGAGFGAAMLAGQFAESLAEEQAAEEATEEVVPAPGDVQRYSAEETVFTFPAALEEYGDGRYADRCPSEFSFGCWENAIITEASCGALEVDLEFTNDDEDWLVQARETVAVGDVVADEITPVVYGHDGYEYGWIIDVRCLDDATTAEPATNASAVSIPLARDEAAEWASADTGFWFLASVRYAADGAADTCPAEFERGCWHAILTPESSCEHLDIQYSFGDGAEAEQTKATVRRDVAEGEPIELVFGNDRYEHGWVSHVVCIS